MAALRAAGDPGTLSVRAAAAFAPTLFSDPSDSSASCTTQPEPGPEELKAEEPGQVAAAVLYGILCKADVSLSSRLGEARAFLSTLAAPLVRSHPAHTLCNPFSIPLPAVLVKLPRLCCNTHFATAA